MLAARSSLRFGTAAATRVARVVPRLSTVAPKAASTTPGSMSMKLYIGNLSWDTRADDLYNLFGKYGSVEDAFVATDRETGRSRGFGFVTLPADAAKSACSECDGMEFQGRTIRVNEATPPGERGEGGRGGGRGGYGGGRGGGGGYSGGRGGYGGGGGSYGGGGYGGGDGGYGGGGRGGYGGGGGRGGYGGGRGGGGYGGDGGYGGGGY